jgi:hypothetical protein
MGEAQDQNLDITILTGCWFIIATYLLIFRFIKKPLDEKVLESIHLSLPIGIGLLFILFGIFLININNLIEGVIELAMGVVVIKFGLSKNIQSENIKDLFVRISFPLFLIFTEIVTFYYILFN